MLLQISKKRHHPLARVQKRKLQAPKQQKLAQTPKIRLVKTQNQRQQWQMLLIKMQ